MCGWGKAREHSMGVSMHAMACGQGSTQNHSRGRRRGDQRKWERGAHTDTCERGEEAGGREGEGRGGGGMHALTCGQGKARNAQHVRKHACMRVTNGGGSSGVVLAAVAAAAAAVVMVLVVVVVVVVVDVKACIAIIIIIVKSSSSSSSS